MSQEVWTYNHHSKTIVATARRGQHQDRPRHDGRAPHRAERGYWGDLSTYQGRNRRGAIGATETPPSRRNQHRRWRCAPSLEKVTYEQGDADDARRGSLVVGRASGDSRWTATPANCTLGFTSGARVEEESRSRGRKSADDSKAGPTLWLGHRSAAETAQVGSGGGGGDDFGREKLGRGQRGWAGDGNCFGLFVGLCRPPKQRKINRQTTRRWTRMAAPHE